MSTKDSITTLFLDIGGVLLTNGWDHTMRHKAAENFGLDYDEMDSRHRMVFDTYERGFASLDTYLDRVVFHRRRPFSHEEFRTFMFNQSMPLTDTIEFFRKLKQARGLKIVAVSNEGRELNEHRIRKFELRNLVDFFVSSCFVHLRKPDEALYRLALDTTHTEPDRIVYIDDRKMFAEVAAGFGMHTVHHQNREVTQAALLRFGLSV